MIRPEQIIDLFQTAHDTDKKLPGTYKTGMRSMHFEIVADKTEHKAWDKKPIIITATSNEIAVYEYCLFHLNPLLSVEERKMVWARTIGAPWYWIGKNILNCSRQTAKKRYLETIRMLRMRIVISDDLMKKLPKLDESASSK
jgi:hypothetical protein